MGRKRKRKDIEVCDNLLKELSEYSPTLQSLVRGYISRYETAKIMVEESDELLNEMLGRLSPDETEFEWLSDWASKNEVVKLGRVIALEHKLRTENKLPF